MRKFIRWIKNNYYHWCDVSDSKLAEKIRTAHYNAWIRKMKMNGGR